MKPGFKGGATALAGLAGSAGCMDTSAPAPSGRPALGSEDELSSMQGARAGQAGMGIRNLGYEAVRSEGLATWYFNRATGACARIITSDGRNSDVKMLAAEDC